MTQVEKGSAKVRYVMNSAHRVPMIWMPSVLASVANSTKTGSSNSVPGMLCSADAARRRMVSRPRKAWRTST